MINSIFTFRKQITIRNCIPCVSIFRIIRIGNWLPCHESEFEAIAAERRADTLKNIFVIFLCDISYNYYIQQSYDNLLFYFVYQSLILMTWCEVLLPCYPFLLITKCYRQFLGNRPLFYNLSWFFVYFKFIISFLSSSQESLVKIREHNWLGLYGKT